MKIIQNNISKTDFQSMIYEVNDITWDEFKKCVIDGVNIENKVIASSMPGCGKNNGKWVQTNIDDDFHFEVIKSLNGYGKAQFYLVKDIKFQL